MEWAKILRSNPRSRLWLLCPEGEPRSRTLTFFRDQGVASDRVEFGDSGPHSGYLAHHLEIDAILDTWPYNGHTTTLDALWMGVPVVTLVGDSPVARAGLSILSTLGVPEWIAHTPDEYRRMAASLAAQGPNTPARRAALRARLEASPLMDPLRFTRGIEAAYRHIWRTWCHSTA